MKRTTLTLEDELFLRIKREAAKAGETFKEHLNNLLKQALLKKKKTTFKLHWKTIKGRSRPLIPVDDRDRLYDFFDENR